MSLAFVIGVPSDRPSGIVQSTHPELEYIYNRDLLPSPDH